MILIGVGSNLPGAQFGSPLETCRAALEELEREGVTIRRRSRWYESAPVPPSGQPWFVNAVAEVATDRDPEALLESLHRIEERFGRVRRERNEARILDLDLLAYHDLVVNGPSGPILPHPRLHMRAFVLLPLAELDPAWRHPLTGRSVAQLIKDLPPDQVARPI
ncbi:MAG TPA: 2-amino-4-hydroxy-6-hydroxymethyldihydropteridine diphosphokinase [Alphaproteobacteria bacterium]|nr:2-amino-4-hydroxy-6-hydroxymethyldihydropteridine diphosphokinase [Alphaproteobacteria bacterium]